MAERQTLTTLIIGVIFHTELYGNAMSIFGKRNQILKYLLFNPFFDLLYSQTVLQKFVGGMSNILKYGLTG